MVFLEATQAGFRLLGPCLRKVQAVSRWGLRLAASEPLQETEETVPLEVLFSVAAAVHRQVLRPLEIQRVDKQERRPLLVAVLVGTEPT